ncbi:hypothetical protein [Halorientalis halophila]|uniref:hypothetical protein n=1 Tax=Halorientalis halophila TaxID=3108499 RepID=UPI003009944F
METEVDTTDSTEKETTDRTQTPKDNESGQKHNNNINKSTHSYYTLNFISEIRDSPINITTIEEDGDTIRVSYVGNYSNTSRTTSEIMYLTSSFAKVVNESYHNSSNWNISRLNIEGMAGNNSVIWDTITEDWWAMKYAKNKWDLINYLNATIATGDFWNLQTNNPPEAGEEYLYEIEYKLQNKSDIDLKSLHRHGGDAFLAYSTAHKPNSSNYYSQLGNVTRIYRNFTLPRRLNKTEGWYAGVLNIEIQRGNDTVEWYRYQIRWAEAESKGEITREDEAALLRNSRFVEKDKLRD